MGDYVAIFGEQSAKAKTNKKAKPKKKFRSIKELRDYSEKLEASMGDDDGHAVLAKDVTGAP